VNMEYAVMSKNALIRENTENRTKADTFVFQEKPAYNVVKRIFDIVVSFISLIILIPVFIILSLIIFGNDGHSPFFIQERCGKDGKTFRLYKFRTMCPDAEKKLKDLRKQNEMDGPVFKMKNDPRITKVGRFLRKTSLDELPQLINILKGDMSFVGPRPALPKEVAQYNDTHRLRLLVTPGLTCYWQIEPERNAISFEGWMELDRKYIEDRNMWVDIKIILGTFAVVFRQEGC